MKSTLTFVLIALAGSPLYAQEVQTAARQAPATVDQAFEITLGAGYAQGFGDIGASQRSLTDLSSAGGELSLGVGYRVDRHFLIGAYGSGSKYSTGDFTGGGDVWSATAGLQGNYHFLPENDWDPWVGLGSGWRGQAHQGADHRHPSRPHPRHRYSTVAYRVVHVKPYSYTASL